MLPSATHAWERICCGMDKIEFWVKQPFPVAEGDAVIRWLILGQYRDNCCGYVLTRAFVFLLGYEWNCRGGWSLKPLFVGVGDVPTAFPILCPHGRSQLALRVPPHGRRVRQAPPWASATCQFSASRAALQTGRSKDLLEYRLLAFSLASELFVALTDMKITYQREMTLLLSKSGFHLSPERAVMTVVFFPITSLNFSCTVVFKCRSGDWLTVQQTAGGS